MVHPNELPGKVHAAFDKEKDQAKAALHIPSSSSSSNASTPEPGSQSGPTFPERASIKVQITSWNMGDSLPKGQLDELFGVIPPYVAPSEPLTSFPSFDTTSKNHPYHILVVASQECPTQSGVPRGIAAGVTKGMGGQREKEKLKGRGKARELRREMAKLKTVQESLNEQIQVKEREGETEGSENEAEEGDTVASVLEPINTAVAPHHGHHAMHITSGAKGWSDLLEDYLCNGIEPALGRRRTLSKSHRNSRDTLRSLPGDHEKDLKSPTGGNFVRSPDSAVMQGNISIPSSQSTSQNSARLPLPPVLITQPSNPDQSLLTSSPTVAQSGSNPLISSSQSPLTQDTPATFGIYSEPSTRQDLSVGSSSLALNSRIEQVESQTEQVFPSSASATDSHTTTATHAFLNPDDSALTSSQPVPIDIDSETGLIPPPPPNREVLQLRLTEIDARIREISDRLSPGGSLLGSGSTVASKVSSTLREGQDLLRTISPAVMDPDEVVANVASPDTSQLPVPSTPSQEFRQFEWPSNTNLTQRSMGPYHFLVKERLLGLYLAIFVHRDCLPWVEGYDYDHIPTGLVGGRVGNKGGIGISLQMAGHSFLFVNAHLAAHASKLDTRLSNVDKIRTEMKLDDFLSDDDPRNKSEDLTDRFDTVFWVGDLNFRLDVSRIHADWLISRKEYAQALEFDQLRKVMKDGIAFRGYSEAPIDFPPTFKYDVWHSAKRTQSMKRKAAGRRRSETRLQDRDPDAIVEMDEQLEEDSEAASMTGVSLQDTAASAYDRRGSVDSSFWAGASLGSPKGEEPTSKEDESDDEPIYTVPQPHRPIAAVAKTSALKAKSRFMRFVKGATGNKHKETSSSPFQSPSISRQVSSLGQPSRQSQTPPPNAICIPPSSSAPLVSPTSMPAPGFPENSSTVSTSPSLPTRPGLSRGLSSKFKRRLSIGQNTGDDSTSSGSEEDDRAGVYDTSNKKRVPSWCDRVLWKTNIYPDDHPNSIFVTPIDHPESRFERFSHAINDRIHRRERDSRTDSYGFANRIGDEREQTSDRLSRDIGIERQHNLRRPLSRANTNTVDGQGQPFPLSRNASGGNSTKHDANTIAGPNPPSDEYWGHKPFLPRVNSRPQPAPAQPSATGMPDVESLTPMLEHSNTGAMPDDTATHSFNGMPFSGARKWLHHLPNLLNPMTHRIPSGESGHMDGSMHDPPARLRKRKGEIECLTYGTIDDVGMRRLEGRSDHRPIKFGANVYV